jgi:hypothetical protein
MRIPAASLTQAVSVAIGLLGVLGNGGALRAEPISALTVEPQSEPAIAVAADQWPEYLERPDQRYSDAGRGENSAAPATPGRIVVDRQLTAPRSGQAKDASPRAAAQAIEASALLAASERMDEPWMWESELKEAVRPLYEELAVSGVVDAVGGLKSYLGLNSSSSFDVPSATGYGAAPESAPWDIDARDRQRSAAEIEKDRILTSIMIEEFIGAVKPWLLSLAAIYLLWRMVMLGLDYFSWKKNRALKRSSRGRRRSRADRRPG